ncbi:tRNA uridine-5-carboxymethylaminomethyl(34) synthesis GTPase MnmE [Hoylesella enoeca]|uniref:tRNA uridine-5-carboxymethylaminomethyl(34) synthesis GTPase MnmE n=1 Tax=Hoylesella enoeca TaxID=76123 RepID=UPI00288B1B77|nr:tRNA uridine-5-carboxymethylaminomethyl(34) synthesis GTPase MnmE [Hoylesella enoeca]
MMGDTICALATSAGGAIGIIRVSGQNAIALTDIVFRPAGGKSLCKAEGYTIHYGEIIDKTSEVIDEVLVSVFRAPHSYTGEDSTEISCHGSRYILRQVLQTLIDRGCRQAQPGEYTQRAYLNGKMDLSQAEAVADLIAAGNRATHRLALGQLKGHFSEELARLREQLLKMTSLLELELDFSDQDVNFADRHELLELALTIDRRIVSLAHSFEAGNALKKGVPVAIVGKTNVGKSTLLNRLLHEERAIVSDIHGTTRDVIEDTVDIRGITFRFIDTAGIRHTVDRIEQLGIERTYRKLDEATIILWLFDEPPTTEEYDQMKVRTTGKKLIKVFNKVDLPRVTPSLPQDILLLSAKQGDGVAQLEEALCQAADIPEFNENDVVVTSARHYDALTHAHDALVRVIDSLEQDVSGDLLSEDLRQVLTYLANITGGVITTDEVLNSIFKNFCIGK